MPRRRHLGRAAAANLVAAVALLVVAGPAAAADQGAGTPANPGLAQGLDTVVDKTANAVKPVDAESASDDGAIPANVSAASTSTQQLHNLGFKSF